MIGDARLRFWLKFEALLRNIRRGSAFRKMLIYDLHFPLYSPIPFDRVLRLYIYYLGVALDPDELVALCRNFVGQDKFQKIIKTNRGLKTVILICTRALEHLKTKFSAFKLATLVTDHENCVSLTPLVSQVPIAMLRQMNTIASANLTQRGDHPK